MLFIGRKAGYRLSLFPKLSIETFYRIYSIDTHVFWSIVEVDNDVIPIVLPTLYSSRILLAPILLIGFKFIQ